MKVNKIWFREKLLVPQIHAVDDKGVRQKLKLLRKELQELLSRHRFVAFAKQPNVHFDNQLNCLWLLFGFKASPEEMFRHTGKLQVYAFKNWELPSVSELRTIATEPLLTEHPKFHDTLLYSQTPSPDGETYKAVRVGKGEVENSRAQNTILPLHRVAQKDVLGFIIAYSLIPRDLPEVEDKLRELYDISLQLSRQSSAPPPPSLKALQQHLLEGDYVRARLPVLEPAYLHDMEKGLWELHTPGRPNGDGWVEVELEEAWEARNPEDDVSNGVVAIDFGTSSTVVACREKGRTTLMRVGMPDFFKEPTPEDYQNPTVLEFLHLPNLLNSWQGETFRPLTRWEDFHFSHEALAHYQENAANQRIVGSMLTSVKQWPLTASGKTLRITDQRSGIELEIPPPTSVMPLPGQPLTLGEEEGLDPIELYAYYLGLYINHRSNGLFLEYYMTFPITYPREVKRRILASFARGVLRSFPFTMADSPLLQRFSMREEASEPAAYAACALSELAIEASIQGTAYAVFDFGGGSTDFDFGLYRLPSAAESERGYERVIEHFGASGDMYLGGENLVANLVYLTFQHNLELCRQHRIPFACPADAERFPGHEMFIDNSHVAQTNSALLMAKVRPVWEEFVWGVEPAASPGGGESPRRRRHTDYVGDALGQVIMNTDFQVDPAARGVVEQEALIQVELELLTRDRSQIPVTFQIDRNRLNHHLVQRVGQGIYRFFIAMARAFSTRQKSPEQVHVLLAGNASRSPLVQSLFAAFLQERMVGWEAPPQPVPATPAIQEMRSQIPFPHFVVHRPPVGDPRDPYKPTAKTGVAIGLLKLIPGEPLLVLGPHVGDDAAEAPFRFFVGGYRQGRFHPAIMQNGPYGLWEELGIPTRGVFVLAHTTSPQAATNAMARGAAGLLERNLRLPPAPEGKRLFIRVVGPAEVELALADSVEQVERYPEEVAYQERIDLD